MNEPTLDALTQRLDRLERENRYLKISGIAAAVILAAGALLGAAASSVPQELRAKKFVLTDDTGARRAVLETLENGASRLALYKKGGKGEVELAVGRDGVPYLVLTDSGGLTFLGISPDGSASINLGGSTAGFLTLRAVSDGSAQVSVRGKDSKGALQAAGLLKADSKGEVSLVLHDPGIKSLVRLIMTDDGSPRLILTDRGGYEALLGQVGLQAKSGVVEQRAASSLVLFDKDGKVIWKAP